MLHRILTLSVFAFAFTSTAAQSADEPAKKSAHKPDPVRVCSERFWIVSGTVLDHQLNPPTRQEMFAHAIRGLFAAASAEPLAELERKVSVLVNREQFTEFLKDNWPASKVEPDVLVAGFTGGMLAQSSNEKEPGLIPLATAKAIEGAAANRYVGTGIQIRKSAKDGPPEITVAFPNGPARKAGGKNGDLILEVDGVSTEGLTLGEVVDRIRGEEGTKVSFTVRQPDEKATRRLDMTRGPVPFTTVFGYKRISEERWQYRVNPDQPIAYLRLESILPSTPAELRKLEATLLDDGAKGLVLDLRAATGGDVQPALLTADELLPGGLMCKVQDARHHIKEYRADKDCIFRDCKIVVLVNEFTQNAGELLAAALQDNDRAIIVGQATRGDGSVISMVHLPNDLGAVQLRTGRVERAKGKGWRPITPDHMLGLNQDKTVSIYEWQRTQSGADTAANASKPAPDDPQLAKALDLLQEAIKK